MSVFTFRQLVIGGDIITTTLMNNSLSKSDIVVFGPAPINELVLVYSDRVELAMTGALIAQFVGRLSPPSQAVTFLLLDNYPRLLPGAPGCASALEESIQNFMGLRAAVRAYEGITDNPNGWLGEKRPGVKQRRLKQVSSPGFWIWTCWIHVRRLFSSMKVGIDGV
ncbi:hypothetical protein BKA70DRAFT_1236040 [Coprinopsis sp. MPI-PUGE-AT-0042]|nr:hypothetical protein BKA70DRAFT_1236040 [Coprinopsis sp. MPI-PUGE-AT-0042]